MAKKKRKKGWLSTMMSGTNGDASSKRFFGGIGLMIMHAIGIFSVISYPDSHWIGELLITLTVTDTGLLGVSVFEKERPSTTILRTRGRAKQSPVPDNPDIEEEYDETEG